MAMLQVKMLNEVWSPAGSGQPKKPSLESQINSELSALGDKAKSVQLQAVSKPDGGYILYGMIVFQE